MGDLKSWLIFVAGALAALAFGIMCLVAVTTALIRLVSGRGQTRTKIRRVASAKERWQDNKLQAYTILVTIAICSTISAAISLCDRSAGMHWIGGALLGSIAGLVIGLVVSGAVVLLIRGLRTNSD